MAISQKWRLDDAFQASWSVGQIRAPFSDVVSTLAKSHSYQDTKQSGHDTSFRVTNDDAMPLIAFATASTNWTYLECVWGAIDFGPLIRLSKTAKADLLVADYCDDPCGMAYGHFQSGRLVEQFMTIDPEWPETRALDGKEKKWKTSSSQTQCIFGKRDSELNIETDRFDQWWNDVSDSLSLDIPYRCWTVWKDDDNVGVDVAEFPNLTDAHLFTAK